MNAAGEAAPCGTDSEKRHARHKYPPPSEKIAQRPAYEDEGGEEQRVALHHPLHIDYAGVEIRLQRGQRDVHHGAIDEGEGRSENYRDQDPRCSRLRTRMPGRERLDFGLVAWRFHEASDARQTHSPHERFSREVKGGLQLRSERRAK